MVSMLDKLITCCVPKVNQKRVKELIQNEEFHYVEPKHGNEFIDLMWDLGQAINESRYIEIDYLRTKDKAIVHRRLQPVAIMFSEYYFYLTAFIEDEEVRKDFDVINDSFPTIYRIDRIKNMSVLDERFHIPYSIVAALRKASLEKEFSLCMVERFKRLGSDIKVLILILSLINCQPHMCLMKKMASI